MAETTVQDDILGKNIVVFFHPGTGQRVTEIARNLKQGGTGDKTFRNLYKQGFILQAGYDNFAEVPPITDYSREIISQPVVVFSNPLTGEGRIISSEKTKWGGTRTPEDWKAQVKFLEELGFTPEKGFQTRAEAHRMTEEYKGVIGGFDTRTAVPEGVVVKRGNGPFKYLQKILHGGNSPPSGRIR